MSKLPLLVLRGFFLAILVALSFVAMAQDVLTPKWSGIRFTDDSDTFYTTLRVSNDGSRVFLDRRQEGFSVYDINGVLKSHAEPVAYTNGLMSVDGNCVYYSAKTGTTYGIYRYQVSTGTATPLPGISETNKIEVLDVSPDGKKLAYSSALPSALGIYNIETDSFISRSTTSYAITLKFINSSSAFITQSFKAYNLSGVLLYEYRGPTLEKPLFSPDGASLYVYRPLNSSSNTFSTYARLRTSDFSVVWEATIPTPTYGSWYPGVSDDGSKLYRLIPGAAAIEVYSTADYSLLGNVAYSKRFGLQSNLVSLTSVPGTNKLLALQMNLPGRLVGSVASGSYDSGTGSGAINSILVEGAINGFNKAIGAPTLPIPNLLSQISSAAPGNYASILKDTSNGSIVDMDSVSYANRVYSPDSVYYAAIKDSAFKKVGIYRSDNDQLVAEWTDGAGHYGLRWDTPGYVTVWGAAHLNQALHFDGSSLVFAYSVTDNSPSRILSPEGTIGAKYVGRAVAVFENPSGTVIRKIFPLASTATFDRFMLAQGYRLMMHEWDPATNTSTARIYDVSGVLPVLTRTVTENYFESRMTTATISLDGIFLAMGGAGTDGTGNTVGAVKVYRTSDASVVRDWQNQFFAPSLYELDFSADDFVLIWRTGFQQIAAVVPVTPSLLSFSSSTIVGGGSVTATISMNRVVNQNTAVHPSSSSGLVVLPGTVTIPAGSSSVTFTVQTHGANAITTIPISCTYNGGVVSANLTITSATSLTVALDKSNVEGLGTVTGTITLDVPAGPGGRSIKITSDKTSAATVSPATVVIPADATTGTFTITTKNPLADYLVTFTAKSLPLTGTAQLMVARVKPLTLTLDKTLIAGGDTATLTITRTAAAPTGGLTYQLSSNNTSLVPPTQIVLPEGETTASVTVNTLPVSSNTTATITLTNGSQVKTINATVKPIEVTFLSSNPTDVTGAGSIDVTITLNGPAPAGFTVAGSSNAAAIVVPATISIPTGQTTYVLTLAVKKVTVDRTATITIGGKSVTITLHAS